MARNYQEEEKIQYLKEFKSSGLSMSKFAKEKGIPKTTLESWIKGNEEIGFEEINVSPKNKEVPKSIKKAAMFANETVRIELKEGFDKELVLKIVEVMVNA